MRPIRALLHLCFACVPGCGQMSQGYMKRGLSQSVLFFLAVALAVVMESEVLLILLAPLWIYSFFDSFNLRRALRDGYPYEDEYLFGLSGMDTQRLTDLFCRRHSVIGWVLLLAGFYSLYKIVARTVFGWLSNLFPWLDWLYELMVWDAPRILVTFLVIGLGLWFIRGPKHPQEDSYEEPYSPPPPSQEPPPKMDATPWTEDASKFRPGPEPQAPGAEPSPVTLTWKSAFDVEKFEKAQEPEQEDSHDGGQ